MSTEAKSFVVEAGWLPVGNGYEIYFEDWGNADATPIMHFHGGPGTGFNDTHKTLYDPTKHRVIFFDQRGCGKSRPFAEIAHNTTPDLIDDAVRLREHLGITRRMHLAGGSWGSALSLFYAIAHPEQVERMMLWSVFLATRAQTLGAYTDHAATDPSYPYANEWQAFMAHVPEEKHRDPESILEYLAKEMVQMDSEEDRERVGKLAAAYETNLLAMCAPDNYEPSALAEATAHDANTLANGRLEVTYEYNNFFMPDNYIVNNVENIRHIPCFVLQGERDLCTPIENALQLQRAYGEKLLLTIVKDAGHLRSDANMKAALQRVAQEQLV